MAEVAVCTLKRLVLSFKSGSCTLSPSELQAYPDSLLSRTAGSDDGSTLWDSANAGQQGAQSLTNSFTSDDFCLHIKLGDLPNNLLNEWSEAPQLLPVLYRKHAISVSFLEQMLRTASSAQPTSSSGAAAGTSSAEGISQGSRPDRDTTSWSFYNRLASVLKFIGLPGPVSHSLPMQEMQLAESRALQFSYACVGYEAAELILSYKPHAAAAGGYEYNNLTALVVLPCKDKVGLDVKAIRSWGSTTGSGLTEMLNEVMDTRGHIAKDIVVSRNVCCCWKSADVVSIDATSVHDFQVYVQQLPVQGKQSTSSYADNLSTYASKSIAPYPLNGQTQQSSHGKYILEALHASCAKHLSVICCHIALKCAASYSRLPTYIFYSVPVWVLKWA